MTLRPSLPPEQAAALFADIIERLPAFDYSAGALQPDEIKWLGRAEALLCRCGESPQVIDFRVAAKQLYTLSHSRAAVLLPLQTAFSMAELDLPTSKQGAYIPAGDRWNGYASIVTLLAEKAGAALLVDPYLDGSFFINFVPLAHRLSKVRCLTSDRYKSSLEAASERWLTDRRPEQPLEVRMVDRNILHDRLLLFDNGEVYLVSQSFKDIGAKSPASIQRASEELALEKVNFYEAQWRAAEEAFSYPPA